MSHQAWRNEPESPWLLCSSERDCGLENGLVRSCVFCPEVWRKIFPVVALGMVISHVQQITQWLCVSRLLRKESGGSWPSKMFLRYESCCCRRSRVWHSPCQQIYLQGGPALEAECPEVSAAARGRVRTVLPAAAASPRSF